MVVVEHKRFAPYRRPSGGGDADTIYRREQLQDYLNGFEDRHIISVQQIGHLYDTREEAMAGTPSATDYLIVRRTR